MNEKNSNLDGVISDMTNYGSSSSAQKQTAVDSKTAPTTYKKPQRNPITGGIVRENIGKPPTKPPSPPNSDQPVSCPDGYVYNEADNNCYKCPDGFIYNETDNNCYPISEDDTPIEPIDDGGNYSPTIEPNDTPIAEGGYANEDIKIQEENQDKLLKKTDNKIYWYGAIAIGILVLGYILTKTK